MAFSRFRRVTPALALAFVAASASAVSMDTIVLIDNGLNQVRISPMGRAIGHFARAIGRGAVRLEATSNDPRSVGPKARARLVASLEDGSPEETPDRTVFGESSLLP